jgi:hypothetical protein
LWKAPNTPGPGSYAVSNSPNHPVVSQVVSQDPLLADPSATSLDRSSAGKNRSDLCSLHLNCCWFKAPPPRAPSHTRTFSYSLSLTRTHNLPHDFRRMLSRVEPVDWFIRLLLGAVCPPSAVVPRPGALQLPRRIRCAQGPREAPVRHHI